MTNHLTTFSSSSASTTTTTTNNNNNKKKKKKKKNNKNDNNNNIMKLQYCNLLICFWVCLKLYVSILWSYFGLGRLWRYFLKFSFLISISKKTETLHDWYRVGKADICEWNLRSLRNCHLLRNGRNPCLLLRQQHHFLGRSSHVHHGYGMPTPHWS